MHVSLSEYEHEDRTYSSYSAYVVSTPYPVNPVGTASTRLKAAPTGTGYYYPAASAVEEFTGAAGTGKEVKAMGALCVAVVAVAAFL